MERALSLARGALGSVSPNPAVGAVIVAPDGTIVGEGSTQHPPGPHAEIVALRQAGERARGGTLFVTLEPCNHQGRTPPCTQAIIAAGIREVRYSMLDPNQAVPGGGGEALKTAGIKVVVGEGEAEARRINEAFITYCREGRSFVVAKFAASLDGRIASASGDSRWVSGPDTRRWAHTIRTQIDAILVGSETVVVDDPQLTARPDGREAERQPLRIVLDTRGRISADASLFAAPGHILIATGEDTPLEWVASLEARGAEVVRLPKLGEHVDLFALLRELARRDVLSLLVEGGGVVLGGFFDRHLVDKVYAVIAPMIIGAAGAPSAVAGQGAQRMSDAVRLGDIEVERLGDDLLVTGYPRYGRDIEGE